MRQPSELEAWLFNEAEALAKAAERAPQGITIRARARQRGRKKLDAALLRVDVGHDLPQAEKVCAEHGSPFSAVSEQLDYKPAQVRVIRNIRPKYTCPCCAKVAAQGRSPPISRRLTDLTVHGCPASSLPMSGLLQVGTCAGFIPDLPRT